MSHSPDAGLELHLEVIELSGCVNLGQFRDRGRCRHHAAAVGPVVLVCVRRLA